MPELPEGFELAGDGGRLTQVAYANDPIEAEMIQRLLKSFGVPSILQPAGFTGRLGSSSDPRHGYMNSGPQRVMVHANRVEQARALLTETPAENEEDAWPNIANARNLESVEGEEPNSYQHFRVYAGALGWSLAIVIAATGVFLLLRALF
jgi:hypothetical protein